MTSANFCWIHMESSCIVCENDQRKKIIKDALEWCEKFFGSESEGDELFEILERKINPSTIDSIGG
jgi:hypothetical protein